ncbi:MAG: ComEC/Rec2 family competence protein [Pseudomonadota bacterium]
MPKHLFTRFLPKGFADSFEVVDGRLRRRQTLRSVLSTVQDWSRVDLENAGNWAPVFFGAGVVLYFSLRFEPPAALFLYPSILCVSGWIWLRQRRAPSAVILAIGAIALLMLGALTADIRTALVSAPKLERPTRTVSVIGKIVIQEDLIDRRRLTIEPEQIDGIDPFERPARIRVSWRGKEFDAGPGDRIKIPVRLSPPPPKVAPHSYDFARQLFFERIGAVGFAVGAPERLEPESEALLSDRVRARIEKVRVGLAARIRAAAPGPGGGILAALATGKRGGIDTTSEQALRDAGLAHLLAISGLHMGLAAGIVFFSVRLFLSAIPTLALHYPIKKWAAVAALIALFAYLVLSGSGWSARRAFVMTGVFLAAIIADRRAISMRNVAIAALLILVTTPEAVLHPGFQMSFAATTALIAFFSATRAWWVSQAGQGPFLTLRRYVVGVAATDTVAATATSPFGLFHFHRAAIYSVVANLAATPLMALWIMPCTVLGILLSPISLDTVFWQLGALGVNVVLWVAEWVSGLEGAVFISEKWPGYALGLVALGGLWVCLSLRPWRFLGFAVIGIGFLSVSPSHSPDVFIDPSGGNVAISMKDDAINRGLVVLNTRKDRFAQDVWMELSGLDPLTEDPQKFSDVLACDELGCVRANSSSVVGMKHALSAPVIAVSQTFEGLADDCDRADLVIAVFPVSQANKQACQATIIDRSQVWREGAHSIRFAKDDLGGNAAIIESTRSVSGNRPWSAF